MNEKKERETTEAKIKIRRKSEKQTAEPFLVR